MAGPTSGTRVTCPLCGHAPDHTGMCPDCRQDLTPVIYLDEWPALQYNRGLALAAEGEDTAAVAALQRAVDADPSFVDAWMVLGKVHARSGDHAAARRAFAAVERERPGHEGARAALDAVDGATAAAQARQRSRRTVAAVAAVMLLALVGGILWALWPSTPPRAAPPFVVASTDGGVVLTGQVTDTARKQALLDAASAASGGRPVAVSTVVVDPAVPPSPGLDPTVVAALVEVLVAGPPGDRAVVLGDARAVLSGAVPDEAARRAFVDQVGAVLPGLPVQAGDIVLDQGAAAGERQRAEATLAALQEASPIRFGSGERALSGPGRATVLLVAAFLRDEPRVTVLLTGHAARVGENDPANAQRVSLARAEMVRAILVEAGVDPTRVTVEARSDAQPLATGEASRRVEIVVDGIR